METQKKKVKKKIHKIKKDEIKDLSQSVVLNPKKQLNIPKPEEPRYSDDLSKNSSSKDIDFINGNKTTPHKKKIKKIIKLCFKRNNLNETSFSNKEGDLKKNKTKQKDKDNNDNYNSKDKIEKIIKIQEFAYNNQQNKDINENSINNSIDKKREMLKRIKKKKV